MACYYTPESDLLVHSCLRVAVFVSLATGGRCGGCYGIFDWATCCTSLSSTFDKDGHCIDMFIVSDPHLMLCLLRGVRVLFALD